MSFRSITEMEQAANPLAILRQARKERQDNIDARRDALNDLLGRVGSAQAAMAFDTRAIEQLDAAIALLEQAEPT